MVDWYYHEKEEVLGNMRDAKREIERLRGEMQDMRRMQEKILDAFNAMAEQVREMHEEMYPTVQNTKPGFKKPGRNG